MRYVTTYNCPDIDGIACCIGYKELLNNKIIASYYGDVSREVEFVKNYTNFFPVKKHSGSYPKGSSFVLVDTTDADAIEPSIDPLSVVQVFDHRELVFSGSFTNAKFDIEKVGSCATLITELFQKEKLKPSAAAATYLFSAIISNTINFKNSVTTEKDKLAARWLKKIADLDNSYIKKMFEYKSRIDCEDDLLFLLNQDYATHLMYGKNVMIAQIEIAKLKEVILTYKNTILNWLLSKIKEERLDYAMLTGVDIVKGYNIFVTVDKKSDTFFSKVMGLKKIGGFYKTNEIIMRKEIWPKVDGIFKK